MTVALAVVVVIGLAGVVGIGIFSPGEAFFVLGAGMTVLGMAMAGMLFSMHRTQELLKEQQSTIDYLQNARSRAVSEEQGRTDRSQEGEIDEVRSRVADLEAASNPSSN